MASSITMPALSPTMEEGTLAKWHVKPGDKVQPGDIIAEIETDKATMDLEAVDEGVIGKLLVEEGAQGIKVNAPIAEMEGEGASSPTRPGVPPEESKEQPKAPSTASRAEVAPRSRTAPHNESAPPASKGGQRIKASPLARRIASAEGIDLSALKGSGPHGRIIKADLKTAPRGGPPKQPPAAGGVTSLIEPAVLDDRVYAPDSYDLIPLDGVRRVTAKRLTQSFMQVPHFPLTIDLEIDRLLAARKAINETTTDATKVSVNDMLIKASALALIAQPDANASYTDNGIARHKSAHISMAVAIDGGLITPVIRDAQHKGLAQIAAETKDLAKRARDRKLKPQEYMGGTFSISNLGMFGIKAFASILNPPEGMILSVGEGSPRPVVKDGKIEIATLLTVTLTCDHRVVDGATGARWLEHFRQFVETPESMLL
ncbi:MAG: pyruvate dehydrogenase complex dihydrolipoamide acetyltransferase [Alphaproteobacteria bacterium]|nr:pyruvate dehydrogenase complex dihydrolipoamide acetyltransferase [Alphaproteobacteria bacterium]